MKLDLSFDQKLTILLVVFAGVGGMMGTAGVDLIATESTFAWTAGCGGITVLGTVLCGIALKNGNIIENRQHHRESDQIH
jgi:hypothetical protein